VVVGASGRRPGLLSTVALAVVVSSRSSSRASAPAAFDVWFGSNYAIGAATAALIYSLSVYDGPERLPYSGSTFDYATPPCEALSGSPTPCIWSLSTGHIHLVYVFGANFQLNPTLLER